MSSITSKNEIKSFFILFSCSFVYFKLLPINIETQPFIILCFSLYFLAKNIKSLILISTDELIIFTLILFLIVDSIVNYFITYDVTVFIGLFKFLICPFIYIYLKRCNLIITKKTFYMMLSIVIFYLVLVAILGLGTVNELPFIESRAMYRFNFFTSEPSYFAPILALLFLMLRKVFVGKTYFFLLFVLIFLAFLSGSVYNYLVVFCFFFSSVFYKVDIKFILRVFIFILISLFTIYLIFDNKNLFGERVSILLESISQLYSGDVDIRDFIYYMEPSGSTRFILNYMAFSVPFSWSVFGMGIEQFPHLWVDLANNLKLDIMSHPVLSTIASPYPQTYFGNLISALGIFGFVFIFFVFSNLKAFNVMEDREKSNFVFIFLMIFIFSFFQLQITNPILWLFIFFTKKV